MPDALDSLNFRDLGGLPTADGRRLRHGVLYRSEGPASFLAAHREELAALGIRLICDLRSPVERDAAPNDWAGGAAILNMDITADLRSETNTGWAALAEDPSEAAARAAMKTNYAAMPEAVQPHLPRFIDAVASGQTPALIHCTAGKDRTGVLVALLLAMVGVPHAAIVADYLRSDVFAKNLRSGGSIADVFRKMFGFVPSQAVIDALTGVDPDYLAAAFARIAARWGSIEDYFRESGVDQARIESFKAAVLM